MVSRALSATIQSVIGDLDDSEIASNLFYDKASSVLIDPLFSNGGGAAAADIVLSGNVLVDDDGTKSDANTWPA